MYSIIACFVVIAVWAIDAECAKATYGTISQDVESQMIFNRILKANEKIKDPTIYEGDIKMHSKGHHVQRRAAIRPTHRLWPNATVYYTLSSYLLYRADLENAMALLEEWTCIRFQPRTFETNYVYIDSSSSGCWSPIGMQGGRQELSLSSGCGGSGVAQHELMHTIGFHHEQSRPDRDNYVQINFQNIYSGKEHNFAKMNNSYFQSFNRYDYQSVMQYPRTAFSINGLPTIVARDNPSRELGQLIGMTKSDVEAIQMLYNCSSEAFSPSVDGGWGQWYPITSCSAYCGKGVQVMTRSCSNPWPRRYGKPCVGSSNLTVSCLNQLCPPALNTSCDFETGLCGWNRTINSTQSNGQHRLVWTRHSGSTPSLFTGPSRDHTLGTETGHYVYLDMSGYYYLDYGILESPMMFSTGYLCISFWYHMYGSSLGTLRLYYSSGSSYFSERWRSYRYGNYSDADTWRSGQLSIYTFGYIKLQFRGERGTSYSGDIALDDITIRPMYCPYIF